MTHNPLKKWLRWLKENRNVGARLDNARVTNALFALVVACLTSLRYVAPKRGSTKMDSPAGNPEQAPEAPVGPQGKREGNYGSNEATSSQCTAINARA
jgi:hypothetical protein